MIPPRLLPLIRKQVLRRPTRTFLTIGGVAVAMFLFIAVQALQRGVQRATEVTAADTTLIVYRQNRFCPATSRLPEYYGGRIARIPGVASVVPMKIVVNTCAASLDVVTFRGVRPEDLPALSASWRLLDGSIDAWHARADAALIGQRLANRRGFRVGQSFDAAGVRVTVAGILDSEEPQDQNVAYVHLPFLQQAAARSTLGVVTQFMVKVQDPADLDRVAKAIDAEFASEQEPTTTRPEKAFVAQAGADIVHLVAFTRYLGWGCLAAVLALVANSIVLGVQDRIKEHAVFQTLGFRPGLLARLIIAEGVLVGALGGALGTVLALAVVRYGQFTLSTEGLSVIVSADWTIAAIGLVISAAVGVLAGLVPAWQASRREIAQCFRAV